MTTRALLEGVAEYLDAQGVANWTPGQAPPSPGIYVVAVPASPDDVVVLTTYPVDIGYGTGDVTVGLQVRCRGGIASHMDLRDAVFSALDGLAHTVLGGVPVAQIYWQSGAPLGLDANQRPEHSDNYYVQTAWPSPHRPQ